ncbi:hypothetical protein Y032_0939g3133 [Ancylostoma ceylanicum]|uniref:Uncharacterized protein n=1 Tax=Ancylostoma ceylanicum TaxID=53326 RepID=A0A016W8Y4_9BILA|nr:hypothetical protein Y032_0939g3133 [Ancylostoma ceylanicum]
MLDLGWTNSSELKYPAHLDSSDCLLFAALKQSLHAKKKFYGQSESVIEYPISSLREDARFLTVDEQHIDSNSECFVSEPLQNPDLATRGFLFRLRTERTCFRTCFLHKLDHVFVSTHAASVWFHAEAGSYLVPTPLKVPAASWVKTFRRTKVRNTCWTRQDFAVTQPKLLNRSVGQMGRTDVLLQNVALSMPFIQA